MTAQSPPVRKGNLPIHALVAAATELLADLHQCAEDQETRVSAGEAAMNTLRLIHPGLFAAAVGTHVDPTTDDTRLPQFYGWLRLALQEQAAA